MDPSEAVVQEKALKFMVRRSREGTAEVGDDYLLLGAEGVELLCRSGGRLSVVWQSCTQGYNNIKYAAKLIRYAERMRYCRINCWPLERLPENSSGNWEGGAGGRGEQI